jgi:hypothetical protein
MATATFITTPGAFPRRFLLSATAPVSTGAVAVQPFGAAYRVPSPIAGLDGVTAPA